MGKHDRPLGTIWTIESRSSEVYHKLLDKPLLQLEGYLRLVVSN